MRIKDSYLHGTDQKGVIKNIEITSGTGGNANKSVIKLTRADINSDGTAVTEEVPFNNIIASTATNIANTNTGVLYQSASNTTSVTKPTSDSSYLVGNSNGSLSWASTPVTSFGTKTGAITLEATNTTVGHINLEMSNNELKGSIYGWKNYTTTAPSSSSNDTTIPTSAAVWTAITNGIATADALVYKGTISGSSSSSDDNKIYTPAADKGHTYKVKDSGTINGVKVEAGDMLICNTDTTAAATKDNYSTIVSNWDFIQANLDPTAYVTLTGNQTIGGTKTFNSTISGSINGNSATATKLQNGRYLWGNLFDGSSNITGTIAASKIYLNGTPSEYSKKTYALNDYCTYSGKVYKCTTAITTAENWTAGHWTEVSNYLYVNGDIATNSIIISGASGFNYSGIGTGSDNTARPIWFSYNGVNGRPVIDASHFKYNPSTLTLTITDAAASNTKTVTITPSGITAPTFTGALSGNASTVTNGVYTTGNQTIGGTKTFSSTISGSINGDANTVDGKHGYELIKKNTDTAITIVNNKYVTTGSDTSTTTACAYTATDNTNWCYAKIAVEAGDKFFIKGKGGSSPRLYAFYNSSNLLKQVASDSLDLSSPTVITANLSGYLVVNFNKANSYSIQPLTWVSGYKVINGDKTLSTSSQNIATIGGVNITAKLPSTDPYSSARTPTNHSTDKLTEGTLGVARGGTGVGAPSTKNKTYYLKAVTSNADSFTTTTSWEEVPTIASGDAVGLIKFNGTNATVNGWSTVSSNASNGNTAYGYFSSGIAKVANGGTGKSSWTVGSIVYASADTTLAQIANLTKSTSEVKGLLRLKVATDGTITYDWDTTSYQSAGSYKTTLTAVSDPTASGTSLTFIATLSQNTNGVISLTKKTVSDFVVCTSSAVGTHGLVPAPAKNTMNYVLTANGWASSLAIDTSGTASNVSGTVAVAHGGTGATTLTGVLIGNGTSAVTAKAPAAKNTTYWLKAKTSDADSFTTTYSLSTIGKSDVGLGNVENTKLSTWAGSSNITTIGKSAISSAASTFDLTTYKLINNSWSTGTNVLSLVGTSTVGGSSVRNYPDGTYAIQIIDEKTDNASIKNYYSGIFTLCATGRLDEIALHACMATDADTSIPRRIFVALENGVLKFSSQDTDTGGKDHKLTVKIVRLI